MGLDICVYKVQKPDPFENKVFDKEELLNQGYCLIPRPDDYEDLIQELRPYTQEVLVKTAYLNVEAVRRDYGLSEQAYACEWCGDGLIGLLDPESEGGRHITLTPEEIAEKYTVHEDERTLVFRREEIAYWRKHYGVQSFFYDALENVENTGYYLLGEDVLRQFNAASIEKSWDPLPVVAPDDDTALFYWEWY